MPHKRNLLRVPKMGNDLDKGKKKATTLKFKELTSKCVQQDQKYKPL